MPTTNDAVAKAINANLNSPNVLDSNFEPANVVDVLHDIAGALHRIAAALEHEPKEGQP